VHREDYGDITAQGCAGPHIGNIDVHPALSRMLRKAVLPA
jgi:hypothetical protein